MKKKYIAPSVEVIETMIELLQAASGLDTDIFQETEVNESWSREIFMVTP